MYYSSEHGLFLALAKMWVGWFAAASTKLATANYLFTPQLTAQICIMTGERGIINYGLGFSPQRRKKARWWTRTGFCKFSSLMMDSMKVQWAGALKTCVWPRSNVKIQTGLYCTIIVPRK